MNYSYSIELLKEALPSHLSLEEQYRRITKSPQPPHLKAERLRTANWHAERAADLRAAIALLERAAQPADTTPEIVPNPHLQPQP